jgi:hypothetical protein
VTIGAPSWKQRLTRRFVNYGNHGIFEEIDATTDREAATRNAVYDDGRPTARLIISAWGDLLR